MIRLFGELSCIFISCWRNGELDEVRAVDSRDPLWFVVRDEEARWLVGKLLRASAPSFNEAGLDAAGLWLAGMVMRVA